jgi:peptidoglycan/xylan/chitin deacetylase (PgdA/CDA1 family)
VILMYHRVTELASDPWSLVVHPDRFAEHLEVLDAAYDVVALSRALEAPRSARHRVVLTFDDGYADNLAVASRLAARGMPATYFVVGGQAGADREFWWDEVERIFLASETLPATLDLALPTAKLEMGLADQGSPSMRDEADRAWRADREPSTPRQRAYLAAYRALRPLGPRERDHALDRLAAWADSPRTPRDSMRPLRETELQTLASLDGAEVGGHTMTHPVLSSLPADGQRADVADGRNRLREITGRPVESFAYPHGADGDYTAETARIVAEAGFRRACAAVGGAIGAPADAFRLPRFMAEDWSGRELDRRLRGVLGDASRAGNAAEPASR